MLIVDDRQNKKKFLRRKTSLIMMPVNLTYAPGLFTFRLLFSLCHFYTDALPFVFCIFKCFYYIMFESFVDFKKGESL